MCREVERLAPDIAATILEMDNYGKLHPLAGPSMPDAYSQALDGSSIRPKAGACGIAAFRNDVVIHAAQHQGENVSSGPNRRLYSFVYAGAGA